MILEICQVFMRLLLCFFVASLLLTTSCCKVGCAYQTMTLEFIGYEFRELDSTLIRKCEPNTNFSVVLESFYRNSAVTGGDGSIFLDDATAGLDLSKDYQVMVRVTGRTYNISGIGVDRFSCPCEWKRGKKVASYVLDGVRYVGEEIRLHR